MTAFLTQLALVSAGSTGVRGRIQVAAGLIGRDATGLAGCANEIACAAVLVRVQPSAGAIAAGLNRVGAGGFAGFPISTTLFAIIGMAIPNARSFPAIALFAVSARSDADIATTELAIRAIRHAATMGSIADFARGTGDAGIAAAGSARSAVIHATAG